jgi:hypothetical protein
MNRQDSAQNLGLVKPGHHLGHYAKVGVLMQCCSVPRTLLSTPEHKSNLAW